MQKFLVPSLLLAPVLGLMSSVACGPAGGGRRVADLNDGGIANNDPNKDRDGDGFTPNQGDCRDDDATVYPGALELCDGKDHDCDGHTDDICDRDGDGYAIEADGNLPGGDCNDQDPLVGPGAAEVGMDGVDNDCNGKTDEAPEPCDKNINKKDPRALAGALDLCSPWVIEARIHKNADAKSYAIKTSYGDTYKPKHGANFLMLSTGIAADKRDAGYVKPQSGTSFNKDDANPFPQPNNNACYMGPDEVTIHDMVELTLTLKVPTNAKSFSFNFMFVSSEYPEFVGTEFNDKFLVLLDSKSYKGNISFDMKKNPITVNTGFFDVCETAKVCSGTKTNVCGKPLNLLNGTGYEDADFGNQKIGGGTHWLTTTAPVTPGETATLRFIIFDEGDHIYDSSVIIDNFQWQAEGSMGPETIG